MLCEYAGSTTTSSSRLRASLAYAMHATNSSETFTCSFCAYWRDAHLSAVACLIDELSRRDTFYKRIYLRPDGTLDTRSSPPSTLLLSSGATDLFVPFHNDVTVGNSLSLPI